MLKNQQTSLRSKTDLANYPSRNRPTISSDEPLALDIGIHGRVDVLLHGALAGLMTCGVLHPAIVLSQDAQTWHDEDLYRAFVHELEHVRRRDRVSLCLARVVCAAYWFHPLIWIAWRQLVLEAERSCDDAVLRYSEATAYADQLVGLARRLSVAGKSSLLAMANRADLARRVRAVLDSRQRRGRVGTLSVALACAVAAVLALTLSPLRMVAAPQASANQSTTASRPAFSVASVKPNKSENRPTSNVPLGPGDVFAPTGGFFSASNQTLMTYLNFAYRIMSNQRPYVLPKLPGWATTERFDIQARTEGNPGKDEMRLMMRTLLADRFKLAVHNETRQVPMFAIVFAKAEKMGPHLRLHSNDTPCPITPSSPQSGQSPAKPSSQPQTVTGGFPILCNGLFPLPASERGRIRVGGRNVTIGFLADTLSGMADLGRSMFDKTGIRGTVDFVLEWTPESRNIPRPGTESQPDLRSGPTFQEALREQLGLKLESEKGPLDILVVDHVEHPSEN